VIRVTLRCTRKGTRKELPGTSELMLLQAVQDSIRSLTGAGAGFRICCILYAIPVPPG